MKLTKILEEVLSEVGEGTAQSYKYKLSDTSDNGSTLSFKSDEGTEYQINIFKDNDPYEESNEFDYDISFGVRLEADPIEYDVDPWDPDAPDMSYTSYNTEVNKGEMYRVMATVLTVVKKELEYDKKSGKIINTIFIYPTKRSDDEGEEDTSDLRRSRLYQAYIKKNAPEGSKVHILGNGDIEIELPKQN